MVDEDSIDEIILGFGHEEFTTAQVVEIFKKKRPADWAQLVKKYDGPGGRGHGSHYSPNSYMAGRLMVRFRRGELVRRQSLPPRSADDWRLNGFKEAPDDWGSRAVALWKRAPREMRP